MKRLARTDALLDRFWRRLGVTVNGLFRRLHVRVPKGALLIASAGLLCAGSRLADWMLPNLLGQSFDGTRRALAEHDSFFAIISMASLVAALAIKGTTALWGIAAGLAWAISQKPRPSTAKRFRRIMSAAIVCSLIPFLTLPVDSVSLALEQIHTNAALLGGRAAVDALGLRASTAERVLEDDRRGQLKRSATDGPTVAEIKYELQVAPPREHGDIEKMLALRSAHGDPRKPLE